METLQSLLTNLFVLGGGAMALSLIISDMRLNTISFRREVLFGLVLGLASVFVVQLPISTPFGATFDTRAAPVILAAAYGGPIAGLIAAAFGAIARYDVGGPFVWGGVAGFLFYFVAGVAAWLWLRHTSRRQFGGFGLLLLAVFATIAVLPSFFVSADVATGLKILSSFGWVLLCGNIIGVLALGTVIERANRTLDSHDMLLASAEASNNKMQLVLNAIPCMVGYWDKDQHNVFANSTYSKWFGIPFEEIKGRNIEELLDKKGFEISKPHISAVLNGEAQKFQRTLQDASGAERICEVSYLPQVQNGEVVGFHSIVFDITDAEVTRSKIEHAAHHDLLTGLGNRAKLTHLLPKFLENAQVEDCDVAIMILDLDKFKQVNDTLGHAAGDELLKHAANRLRACCRDADLVIRLGGDEFAICIKGKSELQHQASTLAERLIRDISKPYRIQGREVMIGTSVGIAIAPSTDCQISALMHDADVALYHVKGNGRNDYCIFNAEIKTGTETRKALTNDLRTAVRENQLELMYQPIHSYRAGRVCGFDVSVKWQHSTKGLLASNDFNPLAEDVDLTGDIYEWALRTAMSDALCWPDDVGIAFKVMPSLFGQGILHDLIKSELKTSGIQPSRLEIQFSEAMLIEQNPDLVHELLLIKSLGVIISIDEFGEALSSLEKLQMFQGSKLKIKSSIIDELLVNPQYSAVISSFVGLGKALGIEVSAAGIETEEQFTMLHASQCDFGQGLHIGKPITFDQASILLGCKEGSVLKQIGNA